MVSGSSTVELQVNANLKNQISAPLQAIAKELGEFAKSNLELQAAIAKVNRENLDWVKNSKQVEQLSQAQVKVNETSVKRNKELSETVANLNSSTRELSSAFIDLRTRQEKTNVATTVLTQSLKYLFDIAISGTGKAAQLFSDVFSLGTIDKILSIVNSIIQIPGSIIGTFEALQRDPVIATAWESITQAAEKEIEEFDGSLTDILTGIGEVGSEIGKGASPAFFNSITSGSAAAAYSLRMNFGSAFDDFQDNLASIANTFDATILGIINKAEELPGKLQGEFDAISAPFAYMAGFNEPLELFEIAKSGVGELSSSIFSVTQEIGFFQDGLMAIQQIAATGPFELLINQNVRLQEQLLSTQASLAATNKIIKNGEQITDPTEAIQSLDVATKQAIASIRQGSLELVGVTSNELVDVFQILAQNASGIGTSLEEASQLTLSFAASLGVVGVPLFQARQEISSILTGTIDMNSVLAKSIGITNDQVNAWKQSGTVYEQLMKRLEAFRAGNALAAKTLNGVTSNIEELFQEITRLAGEPLLEQIVEQVDQFYQFLNANFEALSQSVAAIVAEVGRAGLSVVRIFKAIFGASDELISQVPIYLFKSLANAVEGAAEAVEKFMPIIEPLLRTMGELAKQAYALGGPFLKMFLQLKVASMGVGALSKGFGVLSQILPGLGEVLFILTGRTNSLVKVFSGLRNEVGTGVAGFLLLGKNLQMFPALIGMIAKQIPIFGGAVAAMVPALSSFGIQLVGIGKAYPGLAVYFQNLLPKLPVFVAQLSRIVYGIFPQMGVQLRLLSRELANFTSGMTIASTATTKFNGLMGMLGGYLVSTAISFGVMTGGIFLAIKAFDTLILKNKPLLEFLGAIKGGIGFLVQDLGAFFGTVPGKIVLMTTLLTGVAIAIRAGIIPALLDWIKVQTVAFATNNLTNLTTGLVSLSKLLRSMGFLGMAASATQASLALSGMQLAAASGTLTLGGFASAAGAAALGIAGMIAPLALLGAALAAIALIRYTKHLKDSTEAAEVMGEQTDFVAEQTIKLASKLKAARDRQLEAEAKGIKLSAEEYKQNADLIKQGEDQVKTIDSQIATLREFQKTAVGQENKNNYETQIKTLERLKQTLGGFSDNVSIAAQDLPRLGTAFEQLSAKAKGAEEAVSKSSGNPEIFKQKAQELVEITQKQIELGQISEEEARRRLGMVASNVFAEQDLQIKAQQAISESYKRETEKRAKLSEITQSEIRTRIAEGQISEIEGDRLITEEKIQQTDLRLEAIRKQYKVQEMLREKDLGAELKGLETRRKEAYKNLQAARQSGDTKAIKAAQEELNQLTKEEDKFRENKAIADRKAQENETNEIKAVNAEREQLLAQDRKRRKEMELQNYEEQLAFIESQYAQNLISEDTYNKAVLQNRKNRINAEIAQQQEALNKLAETDIEGREQINATIDKLQREASELETKERKRIEQLALQDYDEQIAQLEASYAKRLLSEEEYLSQSAALQEERINLEIEQQRSQLNRLAKDDKEGREAIASAIASLEKKKSEIQLAERKRRQQLLVEDFNEELALLRASYASGEMSEIEFARRSIALRNQQKDLQIAQAKEELNLLATTDKEGRERILAQIAQYEAEKADLQAEAHAAEVQQIERAQEEALRAVTAAEQSRLIELQKLYNSGALRASAFEEKKLQASLTRIKAELTAEKDKLAALEALPPLSDPAKERERQKQIFDIRSKIAGQTLQLLQTEEQAYRAYIARIREALEQQNQRIANQIERQNQALQQQTMLYNALGTALSNQNKLLDARRSLSKASADFVIGSLDTISKLETSEFRRQKLAEATATIRLKALQQELEYERQSVMLNQQQNALALEREKIQNRIAQAQAQAEVAGIDAEIAIAKLDRQTTPEQLEALRLKRSATVQKVQGLQQEAGFLEERGAIESQSNQMELQTLAFRQQNQQNSAIADIISSLPEGKRNRYAREFQNQLAQQLGAGSKAELIQQGKVTTQNQLAQSFPTIGRGGAGNPLEMFDPRLEGLQGAASSSAMNNAYNDAGIRYGIRYGLTGMGLAAGGGLATGKELSLPSDFMAQPLGTPTIALPPAMPASQDKPLMLPSLDQKGFTLAGNALQLSSESFTRGVDKFAEIVDTLKAGQTAGVTLNANITIPVQADTKSVGESAKKEVSRQLNDLVRKMEVQFN